MRDIARATNSNDDDRPRAQPIYRHSPHYYQDLTDAADNC